jgi:tRNA threonylcarbamoyladenosine biosynthesis protein TsaB
MAGVTTSRAAAEVSGGGDISGEDTLMNVLILALDTTTRAGSVALMRDQRLVASAVGDPDRTHGERLPEDALRILADQGLSLRDVGLFAVCSGPGSFTGLRVGLSTIQGLALAGTGRVVPVPTLEALAYAALWDLDRSTEPGALIVPWMNAHRGEVFGAVYAVGADGRLDARRQPAVGEGPALLSEWASLFVAHPPLFVGDAVADAETAIAEVVGNATLEVGMPMLAPVIARLAATMGDAAQIRPHAVRPVYVRRPDAELARDRRRDASESPNAS